MRNLRSSALVLAATFAAGCSGGGSNSTPVAPAGLHSAAPVTPSANQAAATLKFTIPAGKKGSAKTGRHAARRTSRTPSYVSEASLGAIVTATSTSNSANNEKYGYDLSASGVCNTPESGPETCTLSIPLFADSYSITIALYDQNESGSAASPAGNLLSIDTESETIVLGTTNALSNFLLHPQVDYFDTGGSTPNLQTFGAVGGTASTNSYAFNAEDADHYYVDFTGNPATYYNGPLAANAADAGDTTGCTSPCFTAMNDIGTSPGATPATISKASDESFTLAYTGGGGPGTGVENSTGGAQPTGQRPYVGSVTAVAADSSGVAQIAPLFAYPASLSLGSTTAYVWAAQYAPPSTALSDGTSYSAYFGTPNTTTCSSDGGATVATVGAGTYYAGYGTVFPVTGGTAGSCTLTLSDGGDPVDTVSVPITVSGGGTVVNIPCPNSPGAPTGSSKARKSAMTFRRMASAVAGAGPTLLQSVTGTASGTLANNVTAGDTLVLIAGDEPGSPSLTNGGTVPVTWDEDGTAEGDQGDMFVYTATVASTGSIGTVYINDGCNASFWLGEFSGTSEAAIDDANAGGGGPISSTTSTTPSIVPNAAGGLVITAADSVADTSPTIASTGYTEFFQAGPQTSLDVQLAISPTTDTTDPISNTFSPMPNADENVIFQIPPASFTAVPPTMDTRKRHVKKALRAPRLQ